MDAVLQFFQSMGASIGFFVLSVAVLFSAGWLGWRFDEFMQARRSKANLLGRKEGWHWQSKLVFLLSLAVLMLIFFPALDALKRLECEGEHFEECMEADSTDAGYR